MRQEVFARAELPEERFESGGGSRTALYLRVSTDDQHLDNQRPDLVRLARQRGFNIVAVFEEKVSVAKKRDEWDRLMLAAHRAEWDVLLVWSLDRLGRSMSGNIDALLKLDQLGVRLVSCREPWLDNAGPTRELLIAIMSWVAQQERIRIGERTRAGLERARSKGTKLGRPRKHVPVQYAKQLLAQGLSYRQAAKKLGVGTSTLHRLIGEHALLAKHGIAS